jgi:hypothetical protein
VSDLLTRLKPGGRQIVVMTRWHEEDLGGKILEREGARWTVLEIPMEAYAGDPLGRAPGEMLWPDYFTQEMLERAKMNPRSWNALYQQRPSPDDASAGRTGGAGSHLRGRARDRAWGRTDLDEALRSGAHRRRHRHPLREGERRAHG